MKTLDIRKGTVKLLQSDVNWLLNSGFCCFWSWFEKVVTLVLTGSDQLCEMFQSGFTFFNHILKLHNLDCNLLGSHLGSDRPGCLAQHWETSQVLNCVSFLGNFLVQRGIQREHQRFHFIVERALQNTKIQKRMYHNLTCYVFTDCSQHAPTVTVLSHDDDITLTSVAPLL